MMVYFLYGTNLPSNVNRAFLLEIFQQFGDITKLYLHPEGTWFKIYFKSKKNLDEAVSLNETPPYCMKLSIGSENAKERPKKQNNSSLSPGSNNGSMHNDERDCYATTGPQYYNIHGICVSTLTADDGSIYVPLDEVREIGFELFQESKIPKNIHFTESALQQFTIYLNIQARKYIDKMQWYKPPENAIEEIKNKVVNKYSSSSQLRNTSFHQFDSTSTSSSSNAATSAPSANKANNDQSKKHQTDKPKNTRSSWGNNAKGIQFQTQPLEPLQPLRHPVRSENVSRNTQTEIETKHQEPVNETPVSSTNGIFDNLNKENIIPKKDNTPTKEEKHAQKCSQPKVKQVELPLNNIVKVCVSYVESQTKCWVYKKEDEEKIGKILNDVNLEVRTKPTVQPSVGKVYAAMYDDAWYRALVHQDTPALKVQYIDFGNFNCETLKEVRELTPEIISEPMLSINLKFATPPQTALEFGNELTIIATKKNDDGSYDVEEVSENPRTPESTKLNLIPAGKIISSNKKSPLSTGTLSGAVPKVINTHNKNDSMRKSPQSVPSSQNDIRKTPSPSLTFKERLQNMPVAQKTKKNLNPDRKSVVDLIDNDSGLLEFVKKINDDTCLAFILPVSFADSVTIVEEITETTTIVGKVGDFVSAFSEEINDGAWVRATILSIENNTYTVASVDYGKIVSTNKVCKLETKFVDIPEFVCLLSGNVQCMKMFEEDKSSEFTSSKHNEITMIFSNASYENITCSRWNPFEDLKTIKISNQKVFTAAPEDFKTIKISNQKVFTAAPAIKELKDRERVLPVILSENKLLVRNKESNSVLAKINGELSKHTASPLMQDPIVGQLVLCPHDTQTVLCRGIIKSLNANYADVEFIDYGFTDTIPIKNVMNITESLAKEDSSLIPIVLKDFEDGKFSDEVIDFIEDCSKHSKKCIAKKCGDNVFDLILEILPTGEVTLSSKFANSSGADNNRLMYKDFAALEMEVGQAQTGVCLAVDEDSGSITIASSDNVNEKMIAVANEIAECLKTSTEQYSPIVDELCLAKFDGEWYRAAVINVNAALEMFDVYYIDFGNTSTVTSLDIRKIHENCLKIPALALTVCVKEMLESTGSHAQKVLDVIKEEIVAGDFIDVEVLKKIGKTKYLTKIPLLATKLAELNF